MGDKGINGRLSKTFVNRKDELESLGRIVEEKKIVMHDIGKIILVLGVLLVIAGGIILLFGNLFSWFGNLPGDIHIKRGNFQLFFPLTSMLLVSGFLSFVFWLIRRFF